MPINHRDDKRRSVLVIDDELINREILKGILQEDYEVLCAGNGKEALEIIRENRNTLSLILLDLIMPVLSGKDLLKILKEDNETKDIPVIVMSGDQNSEVECLDMGAIDFIPKPYPLKGVILARARRTILLSEDRAIIEETERDPLTGLYNYQFFNSYCVQYDQYHPEDEMDALFFNVNRFAMINDRYGRSYADEVLIQISESLKKEFDGAIISRQEGDSFLVYCHHRDSYEKVMEDIAAFLPDKVSLRLGVCSDFMKDLDSARKFDRARQAANLVWHNMNTRIAYYDSKMYEQELFAQQLIEDFDGGLRNDEFEVWYQPKFNITGDLPVLTSAEALVRWNHHEQGTISPGVFIPLFEENGLIQKLDLYVWKTAARKMKEWKERLKISVPVSVNVSRLDLYDPNLVNDLSVLIREAGLSAEELLLEITESAYTEEADQIIEKVKELRKLGFLIEMDDFGTGYSTLNMVSRLPIDAMKIDMRFVRDAFQKKGDTRMIEIIIDIARYLGVLTVAEGVENKTQLDALKELGCDVVQGYYFSKPVKADEFEKFLEEKMESLCEEQL